MARDDWRLRIGVGEETAGGLLGRLGQIGRNARQLEHELEDRRLAVSRDGGTVFVYASSSLELEKATALIRSELAELGEDPPLVTEHWLADEERWDDEPPQRDDDEEVLAEGYAPWEVRIQCPDHARARELADELEGEGYGVVRRWRYVIAGTRSRDEAQSLANRLHGEVEPGGELVWETVRGNPFAVFGGLGDTGGPI